MRVAVFLAILLLLSPFCFCAKKSAKEKFFQAVASLGLRNWARNKGIKITYMEAKWLTEPFVTQLATLINLGALAKILGTKALKFGPLILGTYATFSTGLWLWKDIDHAKSEVFFIQEMDYKSVRVVPHRSLSCGSFSLKSEPYRKSLMKVQELGAFEEHYLNRLNQTLSVWGPFYKMLNPLEDLVEKGKEYRRKVMMLASHTLEHMKDVERKILESEANRIFELNIQNQDILGEEKKEILKQLEEIERKSKVLETTLMHGPVFFPSRIFLEFTHYKSGPLSLLICLPDKLRKIEEEYAKRAEQISLRIKEELKKLGEELEEWSVLRTIKELKHIPIDSPFAVSGLDPIKPSKCLEFIERRMDELAKEEVRMIASSSLSLDRALDKLISLWEEVKTLRMVNKELIRFYSEYYSALRDYCRKKAKTLDDFGKRQIISALKLAEKKKRIGERIEVLLNALEDLEDFEYEGIEREPEEKVKEGEVWLSYALVYLEKGKGLVSIVGFSEDWEPIRIQCSEMDVISGTVRNGFFKGNLLALCTREFEVDESIKLLDYNVDFASLNLRVEIEEKEFVSGPFVYAKEISGRKFFLSENSPIFSEKIVFPSPMKLTLSPLGSVVQIVVLPLFTGKAKLWVEVPSPECEIEGFRDRIERVNGALRLVWYDELREGERKTYVLRMNIDENLIPLAQKSIFSFSYETEEKVEFEDVKELLKGELKNATSKMEVVGLLKDYLALSEFTDVEDEISALLELSVDFNMEKFEILKMKAEEILEEIWKSECEENELLADLKKEAISVGAKRALYFLGKAEELENKKRKLKMSFENLKKVRELGIRVREYLELAKGEIRRGKNRIERLIDVGKEAGLKEGEEGERAIWKGEWKKAREKADKIEKTLKTSRFEPLALFFFFFSILLSLYVLKRKKGIKKFRTLPRWKGWE